ncbi:MAG: type IV secretion system protein [Cellvibrionales bacterium]|nr:type IV secretion system protein [Cellvibrionales bacterium]
MATNLIHYIDHETQKIALLLVHHSDAMMVTINKFLLLFLFLGLLILGYMVLGGYARVAAARFGGFFIKFCFIGLIIGSGSTYNNTIGKLSTELPREVLNLVNCKQILDPSCSNENRFSRATVMSKDNILDLQYGAFFKLSQAAWSKANLLENNLGMWFLSFILIVFSSLFTLGIGFILVAVFLMMKVLIFFGPIFIACGIFKATQNFFVKWFGLVVKLMIIEVFTIIIAIFIHDKLEDLIRNFGFKSYDYIGKISDLQLIYEHITLANVILICSVFLLGMMLLRLVVPIAGELSTGLKLAGSSLAHSSNQFFSSNHSAGSTQQNFFQSQTNNNASYSSLFKNQATNHYKQSYQQSVNTGAVTSNASMNAHASLYKGGTSVNKFSSHQQNTHNTKYSTANQYKMAYQSRFRGITN